jgi:hypothetical protein
VDARIYTRGPAASESAPTVLDPSIADRVADLLGPGPTYVGDGWPTPARSLAELLAGEIRRPTALAVNLTPHHDAALAAVLLAAAAADHAAVVTTSTVDGPLATLLGSVADVDQADGVISLHRREPAGVLGHLASHRETKLGNAWRDALVADAKGRGHTLTKNDARAIVRDTGIDERALQLRITELAAHTLAAVVTAATTVTAPPA